MYFPKSSAQESEPLTSLSALSDRTWTNRSIKPVIQLCQGVQRVSMLHPSHSPFYSPPICSFFSGYWPPCQSIDPLAPPSQVLVALYVPGSSSLHPRMSRVCFSQVSTPLLPLPVPRRLWSHLGVDFITDLPNSGGNTCILVAVDRISKACCLFPRNNFLLP